MTFQPPPGQGPIDPRGAFQPPLPPGNVPPLPRPPMPGMMPPPMPPNMHPGMMPPFPPYMMPPPKQRGGFVRGIFLTLATTIFGLSLTLNIYLLVVSGVLTGGGGSSTTQIIEGDAEQVVAVVPLSGIILEEMSGKFDRWMRTIERDKDIKALVIEIDSPGGSVTSSDEIWHRIRKFKADNPNRPVVVTMSGLAASGGYYVACAGDYLFAQPSTLTGNIGVLLPQYNLHKLAEKWGVEDKTIVSQGAHFKDAGSWLKPESSDDRAYLQDIADKAFAQFKDVVAKGRTGKGKFDPKRMAEIANGKIYMAADALALGLIDEIGYQEDAYKYAAGKANLKNMMVVKYRDPPTLFDALSGKSNVDGGQAGSVNVSGVHVHAGDVRELLTPRLMYLWRGR